MKTIRVTAEIIYEVSDETYDLVLNVDPHTTPEVRLRDGLKEIIQREMDPSDNATLHVTVSSS